MWLIFKCPLYHNYVQNSPTMKFDPEIVVIAGSLVDGLLTDQFPLTYSIEDKEALLKLVNESVTTIGIEEPFETLSVSSYQVNLFL